MGTKLKYTTQYEKNQARKDRQMRHYWRNVDRLRAESLNNYYKRKAIKNESIPND